MNDTFERPFLPALEALLEEEYLAGEKAKIYSNTLTDPLLARRFGEQAESHADRFCALFAQLERQEKIDG